MNGGCHCGRVTVRLSQRPDFLNECNCSLCIKLGALWGYFPAEAVEIAGETRAYHRVDSARPRNGFHFCDRCGSVTHWSPIVEDIAGRRGVNMRLFDPAELRGIEVRYGDRRNHDKAAARTYREPTVFDGAGAEA